MTNQVAFEKLKRYCAYQERCHQEVRSKLLTLKVYGDELEEIISYLIDENYLNEERFARAYARGKFRIKRWGKIRIKQELKKRRISEYLIRKGMSEIDEDEYHETLLKLISKYKDEHDTLSFYDLRRKTVTYLMSKGYEQGLIYENLETKP